MMNNNSKKVITFGCCGLFIIALAELLPYICRSHECGHLPIHFHKEEVAYHRGLDSNIVISGSDSTFTSTIPQDSYRL